MRHPSNDLRYVEAKCSYNESVLGYTAILYHNQLGHFVSKSTLLSNEPIVVKGLRNGFHYVIIFPLLKSSNLVGRRFSFKTSILISDVRKKPVAIGMKLSSTHCYVRDTIVLFYRIRPR